MLGVLVQYKSATNSLSFNVQFSASDAIYGGGRAV